MVISIGLISGLKIGLEYTELDEEDNEYMEDNHTMLISLDLVFVRVMLWTGRRDSENS